MSKVRILGMLIVSCLISTGFADYNSGRAEVSLSINNEIYPYSEFATYVLPNEHLGLCVLADDPADFQITAEVGEIDFIDDCRWIWTADSEPGVSQINVLRDNEILISLHVFTMLPAADVSVASIGEYPEPIEDSPIYLPPDGFIRFTQDMANVPVSPNFVLGQFITDTTGGYPKYLVLRERLLLKLEALLERLNERGINAESLSVLAAYMTPAYNRGIGGGQHSRHIYGGAATVIVDRDADGRMDDLDGNGVVDNRDGRVLFDLIDELYSEPGKEYLRGGLFLYNTEIGPSVMLDARGFRKRWPNESEAPPIPENLRAKHKRQF